MDKLAKNYTQQTNPKPAYFLGKTATNCTYIKYGFWCWD